jgi:hypothetical protein
MAEFSAVRQETELPDKKIYTETLSSHATQL